MGRVEYIVAPCTKGRTRCWQFRRRRARRATKIFDRKAEALKYAKAFCRERCLDLTVFDHYWRIQYVHDYGRRQKLFRIVFRRRTEYWHYLDGRPKYRKFTRRAMTQQEAVKACKVKDPQYRVFQVYELQTER